MTETNSSEPPSDPSEPPPARRADLEAVDLDGEVSLFDARGSDAVALNVTATAIWRQLDGRTAMPEVVARVAAEFGTSPEHIADDVAATVARFRELGLLA